MRKLAKHALRLVITALLGGFLGATLVRVAPGYGAGEEDLDSRLSSETRAALREQRVDHDTLARYYRRYLEGLMRGELGTSVGTHEPIVRLLRERFPETLASVGLGVAFAWTAGMALAIAGATSRIPLFAGAANLVAALVICIPAAVLALLFVLARAPYRLVIGIIVFPRIYQYARNLLGQNAALPHVLMARAKGLNATRILIWHILPMCARPLLALGGVSISTAFAAAIPVEVVCDRPGIGQLAWLAAMSRDLGLLVNLTMVVTLLTIIANSAADLVGQCRRAERV